MKASAERKRREEEKLTAFFEGEQLDAKPKCLEEEYKRKSNLVN